MSGILAASLSECFGEKIIALSIQLLKDIIRIGRVVKIPDLFEIEQLFIQKIRNKVTELTLIKNIHLILKECWR
ncbi:MAG: hypothetical protein OFPII_24970 [Osedax symbiont Rs1]|nr:MAG: hypothetical protein OFPII_24970 [Osedax symbiont Rs1]